MNNTNMYLMNNGKSKEEIIAIIKSTLTQEQVTKNIESLKSYLREIVELVGKEGALHLIERWKSLMYVPELSCYEHTQMNTNNFDQIAFVKGL